MKIQAQAHRSRSNWLKKPINSGAYQPWLISDGSLTRRLQSYSRDFAVQPIKVHNEKPQCDEAQLLAIAPRQVALIREVHLCCVNKPVVFAHSVLPHKSLRGGWQGLGRLGNKPLGGALFANASVTRTPLEFKKLTKHHALYRSAAAALGSTPRELWARRSVFKLNHAMILVTEIFLPQVLVL